MTAKPNDPQSLIWQRRKRPYKYDNNLCRFTHTTTQHFAKWHRYDDVRLCRVCVILIDDHYTLVRGLFLSFQFYFISVNV